ncbi:acetyltransferase (GNAT) family protein [Anaerobacterium chartisolvens]|uniref:Acetyltransferase (GNAT) family protein n=1 Tax=Anaerobacterium chartisolvens TaxID=1297424 RepID=A0A369B7X2_9FIRM|nr:GNAT family N-acetyltransferase [Anaerobacterium chartisolvens]RCX16637.1 acetyltransferase (GNAT) family protein [Anaerobacterium chartisolvens]
MYSLNIENSIVYFKDINIRDLKEILKWYNNVEEFKFATGIDTPMTLQALVGKYAEVAVCGNEFFVGIFSKEHDRMIGIMKGRVQYKDRPAVWISSIVIDRRFQRRGYGSIALELLLKHLKEEKNIRRAYLAVIEENLSGITFWEKQKFKPLRKIENHIRLNNKSHNAVVMYKSIQ